MSEQSNILFQHTREGAQRFEYFLLGISLALCAYVGQTVRPEKLGFSPYTLEVVSVVILIGSIVTGFKRIEAMIATSSLNHDVVDLQARRARLVKREPSLDERTGAVLNEFQMDYAISEMTRVLPGRQEALLAAVTKARRYYRLRNWLLAIGFCGLFAGRILSAYA